MHVDHENIKRYNQVNSRMEILQDYKLGSWDNTPPPTHTQKYLTYNSKLIERNWFRFVSWLFLTSTYICMVEMCP